MKKPITFFVYTLAFILMSMLIIVGCSDDESVPDDDNVETGTVTDIDGNVYNTVIIGNQEWMTENLKTTRYKDGVDIPNVTDGDDWSALDTGAYAWYENNANNKGTYGALYNWYAIETAKLCPEGWRVPTDEEWKNLEGTVDSQYGVGDPEWNNTEERGYDAGKKLKSTSGWDLDGNGTNDFDFSALPGGDRTDGGAFYDNGLYGYWWCSNMSNSTSAMVRYMRFECNTVYRLTDADKKAGFSVRCIRN